jgi:hypothetical protein
LQAWGEGDLIGAPIAVSVEDRLANEPSPLSAMLVTV